MTPRKPADPGRTLCRLDARFKPWVKSAGPCPLCPDPREPYEALIRAIASQQVHANAARAMLGRLCALCPTAPFPTPRQLLALGPEQFRACGFSAAKATAILGIAEAASTGIVPSRAAADAFDDETLIARLTSLRGIGRWTVEMLLIFTLHRPDVLPVDDFGVREGYRLLTGEPAQIKPRALAEIGRAWAPVRSTAAWYLWRVADAGKTRKKKETSFSEEKEAKRL